MSLKFLVSAVALTVCLAGASSAAAADLEVTTDGDDVGNCRAAAPCATIPYAIGQAADGDTIQVGPGEFSASTTAERIVVNEAVTIAGAQAGVDARERDVPATEETVIVGGNYTGGAIRLAAPGATIDGVTVRAHEHAAIQGMISSSGYTVRNTILTDNDHGLDLETTTPDAEPTLIERNRFDSNNRPGLQSGIYGDGPMTDVTVRDNLFTGHENVPINFAGPTAASRSGILISGNQFIDERHLLLFDLSEVQVLDNTFAEGRSQAISVQGGVSGLLIRGNEIEGAVGTGILLAARYGGTTSSGATIDGNSISGVTAGSGGEAIDSGAGIALGQVAGQAPGYAGTLLAEGNRLAGNAGGGIQNDLDGATVDAPNNWWGCNGGAGAAGCDGVSGAVDPEPHAVLSVQATPERVTAGQTVSVTASVNRNSAGQPVSLPVLEGRQVAFSAGHGSVQPGSGPIAAGQVASQYSASTAVGADTVSATLDAGAAGADVFVGAVPTVASAALGGSGQVGDQLTCTAGELGGLPAPTSGIAWLRDGTAIAGQTGPTYTPTASDKGSQIACRVTAANEFGSASADSSAVSVKTRPKNPAKPPKIKPKKRVKVPRSGRVVVAAVKCPTGKCRIRTPKRVKVRIRGKVYVARVRVPKKVARGRTAKVRLVLPRRARRAIRGTRARAKVRVVVTSNKGKRRVVNRKVVLRGGRR